ncbi:hypothetical protein K1T71_010273 [Dendrolimus kikuchii]|uniref:Uncharacterized protein n=1 Tax=Dendrolimus kikuchii TaxID=765133 RepID=A0ACC1CS64_9NEOP|nr:hypothetical protein K1T71_010273 [Dendrolimus kikuchii]
MSDRYSRYETSKKSSNHTKTDRSRTKYKKSKHSKDSKHVIGSKTPPLPNKDRMSVDELLRKRESLREELKKIEKYSDNTLKNDHKSEKSIKKRRYSHDDYSKRSHSRKNTSGKPTKHENILIEPSPEPDQDYNHIDSEDEENIIEQRRKQRRQLLEKFHVSQAEEQTSITKTNSETSTVEKDVKETPDTTIDAITKKATDMFSEKDDFVPNSTPNNIIDNNEKNMLLTDNWDDPEGYYNIRVGDLINNRYTIKNILGQGVFANVVRAQDAIDGNDYVAIKIVRNNDLMYKTGLKEVTTLQMIAEADPENKYHCVRFLNHFMHKNHLCLVLESLHMDLRSVLKKYGRNYGLNMKATMSYSRQLLLALRILKKLGIVHADIKPDNILVNEKKNILKLCDFGSATKVDDYEPTPYLVSRFYRAPEIILGIEYKYGVDIWSAACTIYEMATGKIMFPGSSNNKMLKCFMDLKGKIPSKMIRKGKFKDQHFNYNNNFLLHKKDEITEREKVVEVTHITPTRDLHKELKKHSKNLTPIEEKKIAHLNDLLEKMLMLDAKHRLAVTDCLRHPFVHEEISQ